MFSVKSACFFSNLNGPTLISQHSVIIKVPRNETIHHKIKNQINFFHIQAVNAFNVWDS